MSEGPRTRYTWRRFRRHPASRISLSVLLILGGACALAPWIAPYGFDAINLESLRLPPSLSHWMGTDDLGRDVLTRMLFGGRISLLIGVLAAVLGTFLGTLIG